MCAADDVDCDTVFVTGATLRVPPVTSRARSTVASVGSAISIHSMSTSPPGCIVGFYGSGSCFDTEKEWEQTLGGKRFGLVRIYDFWTADFKKECIGAVAQDGRVPWVSHKAKASNRGSQVPWASIADGSQDAVIVAMADFYKGLGSEVWYVFHHEPRGDPNGTAADFINAWRRVWQVFHDRGADSVRFSWCLAGFQFDEAGQNGAAGWYPGDGYVDIVAPDRYASFTGCGGYENDTFEGRFRPVLQFADEHDKPVAPAEWGCDRHPGDPTARPNWIRAAAAYMKANGRFIGFAWYNSEPPECDWVLSDPESQQAWRESFTDDPYFVTRLGGNTPGP
jgi:hypothetical protein